MFFLQQVEIAILSIKEVVNGDPATSMAIDLFLELKHLDTHADRRNLPFCPPEKSLFSN